MCPRAWGGGLHIFFFNDTATTEIYTLSLHDALPICVLSRGHGQHNNSGCPGGERYCCCWLGRRPSAIRLARSEEHTSELQSRQYLVCRLLLEKKTLHLTLHRGHNPPLRLHPAFHHLR